MIIRGSTVRDILLPALIAIIVYAAVTGYGLWFEGYNSDDWRHLAGQYDIWATVEGRWAQDLIFRYLLGGTFHLAVQLVLAFACFATIALILAAHAAPVARRNWFALLIFVAGINHVYMADALNFDAHVFPFALALLLSLVAFAIVMRAALESLGWPVHAFLLLAAIQLLTLSYAIYQPFAMFGAVLPLLALIRWDRYPLGPVLVMLALAALVAGLAVKLHAIEMQLVLDWQGRQLGASRFVPPDLSNVLEKIAMLPFAIVRVLRGKLMAPPIWIQLPLFAIGLAAAIGPLVASILRLAETGHRNSSRPLELLRAAGGGILLVCVLPLTFWFATTETWIPARALAFIGFWIAAALCVTVTLVDGVRPNDIFMRVLRYGSITALGSLAALNAALSADLWRDRTALADAEMALASQIDAAVRAIPGPRDRTVRLIGTRAFHGYNWGGSLGRTIFHDDNDAHAIFRVAFGEPWRIEAASRSAIACPAFPESGSVYLRDGRVNVCLMPETSNAPATVAEPAL